MVYILQCLWQSLVKKECSYQHAIERRGHLVPREQKWFQTPPPTSLLKQHLLSFVLGNSTEKNIKSINIPCTLKLKESYPCRAGSTRVNTGWCSCFARETRPGSLHGCPRVLVSSSVLGSDQLQRCMNVHEWMDSSCSANAGLVGKWSVCAD